MRRRGGGRTPKATHAKPEGPVPVHKGNRVAFAWWQVRCCDAGRRAWPEECPWHDRSGAVRDSDLTGDPS